MYRAEYKNFRREQFKYMSFFKVKAQIIFTGHLMQLRYREDSSKGFTILKEYFPAYDPNSKKQGGSMKGDSLPPSSSITQDSIEDAKKTIIMYGVGNESSQSLKEILGTLLPDQKLQGILDIGIEKNLARIKCKNDVMAKHIFDVSNGKQIGNLKLNMSIFSN